MESERLAYADHLLTHEGNQKPASLRSGILRCIKKPSLLGMVFYFAQSASWLFIIKWTRRDSNSRPNMGQIMLSTRLAVV